MMLKSTRNRAFESGFESILVDLLLFCTLHILRARIMTTNQVNDYILIAYSASLNNIIGLKGIL